MLVAVRFPEASKGGRGQKALETSGFSRQRVGQARAVDRYCPEMVSQIIDDAYRLTSARPRCASPQC
jgi:hypothetical protein